MTGDQSRRHPANDAILVEINRRTANVPTAQIQTAIANARAEITDELFHGQLRFVETEWDQLALERVN